MATLAETCYVCPNGELLYQYAVMAKVAAHANQEKNRRKAISYNNLRRKLSVLNSCQNRQT